MVVKLLPLNKQSASMSIDFVLSAIGRKAPWVLLLLGCLVLGCEKTISETDSRSSQVSLDQAIAFIDSGSYSSALPLLDASIASGGLSADQYADALLLRACCHTDSGDLEKAEADLTLVEQGAPNPAKFQLTKGMLLTKQGKKSEAAAAFKLAKQLDPSIKIPK